MVRHSPSIRRALPAGQGGVELPIALAFDRALELDNRWWRAAAPHGVASRLDVLCSGLPGLRRLWAACVSSTDRRDWIPVRDAVGWVGVGERVPVDPVGLVGDAEPTKPR